jgi:tripartite ATP-independent transporter DctM subunit
VSFIGIYLINGWESASALSGYLPHPTVGRYSLSVVPLFIIMGYFAFTAGFTRDIFWTARQWVGHLPGGLAIATVLGCAGFAACSGSSAASAAVMGKVTIPEMLEHGYDRKIAASVVAASGTLASLIPPSVLLVIYGIIVDQSIGALLVAGFIPGIVSAIIYAAMIYLRVKWNPSLGRQTESVSLKNKIISLKGTWGIFALIILILGGIYTGIFTPTEAGGVGAVGALVLTVVRRRLTWRGFKGACLETGKTTVMIFAIVVGVMMFVRFLALTGLPGLLAETVIGFPVNRYVTFIGILIVYGILGMFLEPIGMMMLTLPIVFPAVIGLGFDPIWFGIILVKMLEICLITPPVGMNVYIVKSVAPDIPLMDIFTGVLPFFLMDILTVVLFVIFPQIILFLPSTMKMM